jgi:rhodanese-related sulfurtransferase
MGFPNVAHLEPGFNGWAAAGLPVEREKKQE